MNNARRKAAIKKEKRKKRIIMAVCGTVAVVIIAFIAFALYLQFGTQVYYNDNDDSLTITLHVNGTFDAQLFHGITKTGVYTKKNEGGVTRVAFVSDGETAIGSIRGGVLSVPDEWDDTHSHGKTYTKK